MTDTMDDFGMGGMDTGMGMTDDMFGMGDNPFGMDGDVFGIGEDPFGAHVDGEWSAPWVLDSDANINQCQSMLETFGEGSILDGFNVPDGFVVINGSSSSDNFMCNPTTGQVTMTPWFWESHSQNVDGMNSFATDFAYILAAMGFVGTMFGGASVGGWTMFVESTIYATTTGSHNDVPGTLIPPGYPGHIPL